MIFFRKRDEILTSKRKFANVTMLQENLETNVEMNTMENSFMIKREDITETILSDAQNEIIPKSPKQNLEVTISLPESPSISEINCTTTTTQIAPSIENVCDSNVIESPVKTVSLIKQDQDESNAILSVEQTSTSVTENLLMNNMPTLVSPTTPSVPKERKRRIIIDDDDESPTFNPLRSNKKIRGKNRRNKHNSMLKKQKKIQLLSTSSLLFSDKTNENAVFTSPEVVVSSISSSNYDIKV